MHCRYETRRHEQSISPDFMIYQDTIGEKTSCLNWIVITQVFFHDIWKPVVITKDHTSSKYIYHNLMEIKMEILESKKLTTYHLKMHHSLSHP